jgi:NMD protein affecting ribosome stability and mRNA decay
MSRISAGKVADCSICGNPISMRNIAKMCKTCVANRAQPSLPHIKWLEMAMPDEGNMVAVRTIGERGEIPS